MLNHIVSLKTWTITGRKPELKPRIQQIFLPVHHHRHAETAVRPSLFDIEQKTSLRRPLDTGHRSPPRLFRFGYGSQRTSIVQQRTNRTPTAMDISPRFQSDYGHGAGYQREDRPPPNRRVARALAVSI